MIDYFCDRDATALDPIIAKRYLYLVFEYMDTTLWREFQRRKGLFDRQMIIRMFRDICLGVKHLHEVGIVHSDLSVNNFLYSQGNLKVADLGCSSCAATWALPASERGTAHSRAPELWLVVEGKHVSKKVPAASQLPVTVSTALDCWSLGVCLGMLLTGQFIFESFAHIVSCLGPLTDTQWVGCTSLPGYKALKVAELSSRFNDKNVVSFFSSAKHVKYPKPTEDSGLDLISMFLKWPPTGRCTVQQSLDHSFFGQSTDFDGMLRACSHEQLGKLVIDSIQNGVPISSSDMLPPTKPLFSRGIKRRADESQGTVMVRAGGVQDVDANLCFCRGQCRNVACVKACNETAAWKRKYPEDKRQKQICKQQHMPGMRFCFRCKCEITDCDKCRDKCHVESGRWCVGHGKALASDRTRYPNHSGQQVYGHRWSLQLRLTARLAFLLRDMMPQDMTAALDFCRKLRSIREGQLKKEDIMWMALASALEVPGVIDVLWCQVAEKLQVEPTAEDVRYCVQKVMDASTGKAAWVGIRLGFAKPVSISRRRHRAKADPCRCMVLPDEALTHCERLVSEATKVDLQWPTSTQTKVVQAFAQRVVEFVGQSFQINEGIAEDVGFASAVVRKMLLVASEFEPTVFDNCCLSDIMKWTYEDSYVAPIVSMTGAELRSRFGMQPPLIDYWASKFESCDPRELQALQQAEDARLLQVLNKFKADGHHDPTPDAVAKRLRSE